MKMFMQKMFMQKTNELDQLLADSMPRQFHNPYLSSVLRLIVTNNCNLECKYCYNYSPKTYENMDASLVISLIKDYLAYQKKHNISFPVRGVLFTGGEPTLNLTTIIDVIDYLDKCHVSYLPHLVTNGIMPMFVLEQLIEKKIQFQISFDVGGNIFRTPKGDININKQLNQNIKKLSATNLPVVLRSTIYDKNVSQMIELVELAADYEIETVMFGPILVKGNCINNKHLVKRASIKEYLNNYDKVIAYANTLGIRVVIHEVSRVKYQGETEIAPISILPDCSIIPTTAHTSSFAPETKVGHIGRYDSEKGLILNYQKINSMARNFLHNQQKHCDKCECFDLCQGRNQNFSEFLCEKDLKEKDNYACEVTRGIFKLIEKYSAIFGL